MTTEGVQKLNESLERIATDFIADGVTSDELVQIMQRLHEHNFPQSAATVGLIAGFLAAKERMENDNESGG